MLWGVLCVALGGAIGFALDQILPGRNTGFCSTVGVLTGLTLSTYLEQKEKRGSMGGVALTSLILVWFLGLRIFFKT